MYAQFIFPITGWTASDSRPSAIGIGSVCGMSFVILLVVVVVILDAVALKQLLKWVCRKMRRMRRPSRP